MKQQARRDLRPFSMAAASLLVAAAAFGCGKKSSSTDTTGTGSGGTVTGGTGGTGGGTGVSTIDVTQTGPAAPSASDVQTNAETQSQVAGSALNSASNGAAEGTSSANSGATLMLVGDSGDGSLDLTTSQPTETATKGQVTLDCYTGAHVDARPAPGGAATLTWPEAAANASPATVFSDSMTDPNASANMDVETALLTDSNVTPAVTLTLPAPFAFADMVEVIQTDNRTLDIALADAAQTTVNSTLTDQEHRFWVAENAITGQTGAALTCAAGANATGSSGTADGSRAKIRWNDANQTNGLSLLTRVSDAGTSTRSFLPRVKGVLQTSPISVQSSVGYTGYRLVQWTTSSATASTVTNATMVRTKTITSHMSNTNQILNTSTNAVMSDVSNTEEIRASAPLVIQDYRDTSGNALAQVIASGTVMKTGTDGTGSVKWFTTLAYSGVTFDQVNSTQVCVPVSGTVTMTVYDKEGGTEQGTPIVITYSSTADAAGGGKLDPTVTVSGDDANGTKAQWMMLNTNLKCDLKS